MITQERLKELLNYDPETGIFVWKTKRGRCPAGAIAGSPNVDGHIKIRIDYNYYLAHRLAWLYVYGEFPASCMDHANRCPSDNKISNLRPATFKENQQNRKINKNNKSGHAGVYFDKFNLKWRAHIAVNSESISLGSFSTKDEAIKARREAKKKLHTFNPEDDNVSIPKETPDNRDHNSRD